ncbi:hypothetical protein D8B26_007189 [Coccidioides posadasii str. Silveira]|uniref:Mannose-binding lectin n=3 Tax=Coccidioides posadasii TaxID=199306 RepID=E9D301_COCPS|nr:mannose-specific lectin precursor, putative [Coccidioides posadasii C735 delta SOWgp]EER29923.1 mannose-specific lectin precursor, putative [Coccidioides posadasii C735 delta SOWgp]EFW18996.1 mannose-binding lectin [Coccidioides posadasii str. Silveira]KMM71344.1 mannose-binding lectin [Coccidioides posadasii RMSCC 3488]QVM12566.1 hypothetical protein D8B26_007189 [Coccidioides posadasii str. Silveira]|eukprot:XP_003072068.1 mannose-specific lectin precursor, putative [Coccidioides posadasii C735 delta SOWgp]
MSHSTLGNGEWLLKGNSLFSEDRSVEFKMQEDGKIAVYWGGQCRFQNTSHQSYNMKGIKMEKDGVLRMYDDNDKVVWETKLEGAGDSTVICAVQNDGNVVLYRGTPIWASHTQK